MHDSVWIELVCLYSMATADTDDTHTQNNLILEIHRVKEKVRTRFQELRDCLNERETKLIQDLDDILSSYHSYQTEVNKVNEKKRDIEVIQLTLSGVIISSPIKTTHEDLLKQLNEEFKLLQIPIQPKLVTFECDSDNFLIEVNKLGELVETMCVIDYTSKIQPLISTCDRGSGNEQLDYPLGVALDHQTGNIYVVDHRNHCVKVFDSNARYIFEFGEEGEMFYPKRLFISENMVIVSLYTDCIKLYQLDGKFITKFGEEGSGRLGFDTPWGLARDTSNGDIYICDFGNNRIQIISKQYEYKSEFGTTTLFQPLHIILHKDSVFVLDMSSPCLHIFSRDLTLQESIISRGLGKQVVCPVCFFIDRSDNILLSDRLSDCVVIFNSTFHLIHKISVYHFPTGITMDDKDRLIVVCQGDKNCLQIF